MGRVARQIREGALIALAIGAGPGSVWPASAQTLSAAPPIPVPSGQDVRWIDTIQDIEGPAGLTLRFRFLAPAIGGAEPAVGPEAALQDMAVLCDTFALPRLPTLGPQPGQVVISLSDRVVPFGQADDTAVQYFEAFSVQDGACIWELY